MAIPNDLRDFLLIRLEKVRKDALHRQNPYFRLALYNKLRFYREVPGQRILSHLQLITLDFLAPLWQEEMHDTPYQVLPELVANLAEDLLNDKISEDSQAGSYAKNFIARVQDQYYNPLPARPAVSVRAKYISIAFEQCLNIKNINPYADIVTAKGNYILDETDEDSFYLGLAGDIAATALIAHAGIFQDNRWTSQFDHQKSLAFWVWWLTKAIPQAWERTEREVELNYNTRPTQKREILSPLRSDVDWNYYYQEPDIATHHASGKHTLAEITKDVFNATYNAIIITLSESIANRNNSLAAKSGFASLVEAKRWCEEYLV
jgi:hypothetical protein